MSSRDFGHQPAGWPDEDGYLDGPEFGDAGFEAPAFDGAAFDGAAFDDPELDDPELDDPGALPYPLTYERDEFAPDRPEPAAPWPAAPAAADPAADRAWAPWPAAPDPVGYAGDDQQQPPPDGRGGRRTPRAFAPMDGQSYDEPWLADEPGGRWRSAGSGRRRWLIPVGVAVAGAAIGTGAVLLGSGHSGSAAGAAGLTTPAVPASPAASRISSAGGRTAAPSPTGAAGAAPLTVAAARRVLSAYTAGNTSANAARSDAELAMVETGGSYAIDAGLYALQRASGAQPFPPFAPVAAAYYIPRSEPAGGTRWFVVRVANAFAAAPKKTTSTEYLLFTQAAPGARWQNAIEPYLLTGAAAPPIAVGPDGLATAVSPAAGALAVAPGQLAARTAGSLDGVGGGIFVTTASPGLADRESREFWRGKLPGTRVHDAHTAASGQAGQTFALRTVGGGALVFYTDSAELTFTPPAGTTLRLAVPGLYSAAQALTTARLAYLDQFAAYDPAAGSGPATVIAAYSGLTGKN
jgi:hypothetical protein